MEISTDLIKQLRTATLASMKDCVGALKESEGDLNRAIDIVKAKGLLNVAAREGKVAAEGRVAIVENDKKIAMVEVNSQTDFVANSPQFIEFAKMAAQDLLDGRDSTHARHSLIASTKETINIRRYVVLEKGSLQHQPYLHANGKIGVVVSYRVNTVNSILIDKDFKETMESVAMQIAAMNPLAIRSSELSPQEVEKQRAILIQQVPEGKSEEQRAKILEGKLNKFYSEVCLLNQSSVEHAGKTIQQLLNPLDIEIVGFVRYRVGEGIEVKTENFAEEVAKTIEG